MEIISDQLFGALPKAHAGNPNTGEAEQTQTLASEDEMAVLRGLLETTPNTLSRDDWVRVSNATKAACPQLRESFIKFSMKWPDAKLKDAETLWDTAKPNGSLGYGTALYLLAGVRSLCTFPDLEFLPSFDFADIPKLKFLYSTFLARGYTSLTIAAPKVGKSLLALAEALDAASGGKISGKKFKPRRVLYLNFEDDENALWARVAALCIQHNISLAEISGYLVVKSGIEMPDFFLMDQRTNGPQINEAAFKYLANQIDRLGLEILILDPLQDAHHCEETNEVYRILGQRLRVLASQRQVAIHLIHHTRKVTPGFTPSIDDARGGSALRGTSRFNRVLVAMTDEQALAARVDDARYYFRIGDVEANLAPPSSDKNRWFEKVGVDIPNGQNVAALKAWSWPDVFEGVTMDMVIEARRAISNLGDKARASTQSKDWFGYEASKIIGITIMTGDTTQEAKSNKSRISQILKYWVNKGWIKVGEVKDTQKGRTSPIYQVGDVDPFNG